MFFVWKNEFTCPFLLRNTQKEYRNNISRYRIIDSIFTDLKNKLGGYYGYSIRVINSQRLRLKPSDVIYLKDKKIYIIGEKNIRVLYSNIMLLKLINLSISLVVGIVDTISIFNNQK